MTRAVLILAVCMFTALVLSLVSCAGMGREMSSEPMIVQRPNAGSASAERADTKNRAGNAPSEGLPVNDPLHPLRQRISKIVTELESESAEKSVARLADINLYTWPGVERGVIGITQYFPLPIEEGAWDVETILSNRRFLKCLDDLEQWPRSEAARLLVDEVSQTLPLYRTMFEEAWLPVLNRQSQVPANTGAGYPAGPTFVTGNTEEPTLLGYRFKLLSLLMLASNLELREAKPAVDAVLDEALGQRERFYTKEKATEADRFVMLSRAGLYNRQILATVVAAASSSSGVPEMEGIQKRRLPRFDASISPYDLCADVLGVDFSRGAVEVAFLSPLDDVAFDDLIRHHR